MKIWLILSIMPLLGLGYSNHNNYAFLQDEMDTVIEDIDRDLRAYYEKVSKRTTASHSNSLRRTAALPTSTAYSETVITWSASSKTCAAAATTVTISCASGGKIIVGPTQGGVSKCVPVGTTTLKCTKQASAVAAFVAVTCTGKYSVTASLPSFTFTKCYKKASSNEAAQLLNLEQICAVKTNSKNFTGISSTHCGASSELYTDPASHLSFCTALSSKCVSSGSTTCSITTGGASVSSPTTVNKLCIIK
jgi:hypothetical protein